jgi:predicted permease
MLLNNIKIAFRSLRRQPFFSAINIGGLTLSLVVSALMLLWVWEEVKINRFQANGERLCKMYMGFYDANGELAPWETVSYPLSQAGKEKIPEVEDVVTMTRPGEVKMSWEGREVESRGMDATMNFFDWMSFPLLQGGFDRKESTVRQMAVSRSMAERLFGQNWRQTALGEAVKLGNGDPVPVVAVFEDVPTYSTLQFDFVTNLEPRAANEQANWGNHYFNSYLLLSDPEMKEEVRKKITDIYVNSPAYDDGELVILQSLRDQYLYSKFDATGQAVGGRIEYVRIFFFAALFLLIIACVNFVNLATARASKRAKEIGVRKVVGAPRLALIRQFLTESSVITLLSLALALAVVVMLLPSVRLLTGQPLAVDPASPVLWLSLVALAAFTAFLAGAYPALVLSSFRVKNILQGKLMNKVGHRKIRSALVIFQFGLSFFLIVGALVVQRQIQFIKNKNLGLERENVIQVPLEGAAQDKYEVVRTKLENSSGILSVSRLSENPLEVQIRHNGVDWPGKADGEWRIHFDIIMTEENFPETFGTEMAAGRFYQVGQQADSNTVVINETAVAVIGLDDPVGKRINVAGEDLEIIGVMKDFHTISLYEAIPPAVIQQPQSWNNQLFVRTEAGKTAEAIAALEETIASVAPDQKLEYTFLDETYARQYKSEALMGTLANWFALFSLIISCVGMLGLATFSAENRSKEIGVRRVLGATVFQIVQLLSRDFVRLIFLSAVLALPPAFLFSRQWLEQFAYHADVAWWVFGLAFALMMIISVLTVGLQSLKAGIVNPVERLRNE